MLNLRILVAVAFGLVGGFSAPQFVHAADDDDQRTDIGKAVRAAQARTVKLFGAGVGRAAGYASGIIVSPKGHILTANSVILTGSRIRVVLAGGAVHYALVVRRDSRIQTALLKIDTETPNYFQLSEKLPAAQGDWVLSVSNAFKVADGEEPLSVNRGIVSTVTRVRGKRGTQDIEYDADAVLIDAITSNPGAPGGAVVTADGQLVGMIGRMMESKRTNVRLNYAVPAPLLAKLLAGKSAVAKKSGTAKTKSGPIDLGIRLFRLGGKRGPAFVDRVVAGSPAAKAGIKSDDLVLSVEGTRVKNVAEYQKLAAKLTGGKPIEVLIKRKQKLLRFQLSAGNVRKP